MAGENEAAADTVPGVVLAGGDERTAADATFAKSSEPATRCRNCSTQVTGAYCPACGQAAHVHRSLLSLAHDILHSVLHFEGKFWRTVPELFWRPGQLTRRYIDGERVRFVSPMGLYLFAVFLTFAVFSFSPGALDEHTDTDSTDIGDWRAGNGAALAAVRAQMDELRLQLAAPQLTAQERAALEGELADLRAAQEVMEALANGDWERLRELRRTATAAAHTGRDAEASAPAAQARTDFLTELNRRYDELNRNPALLAYKLKMAGYKFSWALIPLSIPFMWLLFFWRRDIRLYDHAVFVTYSIAFMLLLAVIVSLFSAAGVGTGLIVTTCLLVPPLHMYRQLRGAYRLSRWSAMLRLFLLAIACTIVLVLFFVVLLIAGAFS